MNRLILIVVGALGASTLLLVDSTIKGTVLLALAAVAALLLRRDSAATRHLVWLLAIGALLAAPALSLLLPQWRVLPAWTAMPSTAALVSPPPILSSQTSAGQTSVAQIAVASTPPPAAPAPVDEPMA